MLQCVLKLFRHFTKFVRNSKQDKYEIRNLFESIDDAHNVNKRFAYKLYKSIHLSEISLYNMLDSTDNEHGCIIVFSSDMNHKDYDIADKLIKIIEKYNVTGYMFEHAMYRKYIEQRTDTKFDKKSLTIELTGLTDEQSIDCAKELCSVLEQQSVLVRSINTKSIWRITKLK